MADLTSRIAIVISASSAGAVNELRDLQGEADKTGTSFDTIGKKAGLAGATIKGALVAGAGALVGGGLISFLNSSVDAFVAAQDAAAQFARATNATVIEAGKFTTVARAFGLEMNDLIEINAEFSKKIEEQPELLQKLGVEIAKNADGSVNMTKTLVATIDALGGMENGLEAAKIAAELLGEEGSKQMAGFYLQGVKVSDLMEKVDFIDKSEEAKRFAASTSELSLSMEALQIEIGSELVPVLNDLVEVGIDVIGFFADVPKDVYLVVGAVVALSAAMRSQLIVGAFQAALTYGAQLITGLAILRTQMGLTAAVATATGNAIKAAFLSNPLTAVLVVLAAAYTALSFGQKAVDDSVSALLPRLKELEDAGLDTADAITQLGESWEQSSSFWERWSAGLRGMEWWEGPVTTGVIALWDAFRDGGRDVEAAEAALAKAREELGEYGYVAAQAEVAQRELNDLLVEGDYTAEEFAEAVTVAAVAQREQEQASDLAKGAVEAYAAATWDAVEATTALLSEQRAAKSATDGFREALEEYNRTTTGEGKKTRDKTAEERAADAERLVDMTWRSVDATVAAYEAEQQRYGQYPTQIQLDSQRIAALRAAALQVPEGTEVRRILDEDVARVLAGWAAANPLLIPAGVDLPTVDDAIADIEAAIAATDDPELKAQLALDLASLQILRSNIENGEATPVPVTATLASGGLTAQQVVNPGTGAPTGVTVTAVLDENGDTAYTAVLADGSTVEVTVTPVQQPGGSTASQVIGADGTVIGVVVEPVTAQGEGGFDPASSLFGTTTPTVDVGVGVDPVSAAAAGTQVKGAVGDQTATITVNTQFEPGGYEAVKSRRDFLLQAGTADIGIDVAYGPGGYDAVKARKDYLLQVRNSTITINVDFEPGSYVDILNRINTIAKDRSATITINQVTRRSVVDVGGGGDGNPFALQRSAPIPNLYANVQPTNIFKVAIDGQPLRAWIRSEVAAAQPQRVGVA